LLDVPVMNDLAELLGALVARGHRGARLDLEATRSGARALGSPEERLPVVHVAGTNGKGSTSAMLERIAREAGLRTGLYTSPHLVRFSERIRIDGAPIDDAAFASALGRVFADASDELTFFETLTLAAFVAFAEARVELVVLEVGLGGRLDSTNVVRAPLATAITSIARGVGGAALEHADRLGSTPEAIAREKAAIAKPGVPMVLGPLDPGPRAAAVELARHAGAPRLVALAGEDDVLPSDVERAVSTPQGSGRVAHVRAPGFEARLEPRLFGRHQLDNAAVAALTAREAARQLPALAGAIELGVTRASWDGRLERVERPGGVTIWLDVAHNVDGVRALVEAMPIVGVPRERCHLVFGALADKAYAPMLRLLEPVAARRSYAPPGGREPARPAELAAILPGEAFDDPVQAVLAAERTIGPGGHVLVTGSIYLVGEVRAALFDLRRDPPMGL
jgi:dihydrofolate synthase / folylpolyglutamate synthase